MTNQQRKLAENYIARMKLRNELKQHQSLTAKPIKVSQREQDALRLLWEQVSGKAV